MRTQMWGSGPGAANVAGITGVPTTITADGTSEPIDISEVGTLMISAECGAPTGSSPTLNVYLDVQDAIGNWLQVCALTQLTGAAYTYSTVGPGTGSPYPLTAIARFRWDIGGTGSPTFPGFAVALAGR